MKTALLSILLCGLAACAARRAEMAGDSSRLTYGDGSGNTFVLATGPGSATLEYRPVLPGESSSGRYRGGEPLQQQVDVLAARRIVELARTAVANAGVHVEARVMGSGSVRLESREAAVHALLAPQAPEKLALEAALRTLVDGQDASGIRP